MQVIKLTIPYMPELSKNKRYVGKFNKVKNPAHRKAQEYITMLFRKELLKHPVVYKQKCYVDIIWHRSNMRGDVSNIINPVNDALKVCLDFDDSWFTNRTDWILDKNNPRVEIYFKYLDMADV